MSAREFELAAKFCALVGVPTLLAYLGADHSDDTNAVRARLKARRRFMQSMQNNPKYREEALFLIRHFQALDTALADVQWYLDDARARQESKQIPHLESTIRGVLAAGPMNEAQERVLRTRAAEMGIGDGTFERVLAKAIDEHTVATEPALAVLENADPLPLDPNHASASGMPPQPLADLPAARATWEEGKAAQLEVRRPHARELRPNQSSPDEPILMDSIVVENLGEEAMPGTVSTSDGWMVVDPERLDPTAARQTISVQVDPHDVPQEARTATVYIRTQDGQESSIVYAIRRGPRVGWVVAVGIGVVLLCGIVAGLLLTNL